MRRARPKRHGLWGSLAAVAVAAVLADAAWLLWRWHRYMPDAEGAIPESAFIESYRDARRDDPSLPPLRWQPAPLAGFPRHVIKPFIIAEDARFFVHRGIDLGAIRVAIREYLETAGRLRGASTITQQTAKNLFLSRRRNVLRKWHELVMSLLLEA